MEIEQQIIEMAEKGMSQRKIAEELEISRMQVYRVLQTKEDDDSFGEDPDDDMMPLSEMDERDVPPSCPAPVDMPVPSSVSRPSTIPPKVEASETAPTPQPQLSEWANRLLGLTERAVETQNRLNGQLTAMSIRAEEGKNEAISRLAELRGSVAAKEREILRARAYSVAAFALAFCTAPAVFELGWLARSIGVTFSDYLRVWIYSGIALLAGLLGGIALVLLAKKRTAEPQKEED